MSFCNDLLMASPIPVPLSMSLVVKKEFFRDEPHRQMMQFIAKNPQSLYLYSETYSNTLGLRKFFR